MMVFLLFLIVLAITYNTGTARPLADNDLNVKSRLDETGDGKILKLPTSIINRETTININGTINSKDKTFTVALRNDKSDKEDCKIVLDFESKTISAVPGLKGYDSWPYEPNLKDGEASLFSLRLIAVPNDMLHIFLQVDEEGESPNLICDMNAEALQNISYIDMIEGVADVVSMLLEFKENH